MAEVKKDYEISTVTLAAVIHEGSDEPTITLNIGKLFGECREQLIARGFKPIESSQERRIENWPKRMHIVANGSHIIGVGMAIVAMAGTKEL